MLCLLWHADVARTCQNATSRCWLAPEPMLRSLCIELNMMVGCLLWSSMNKQRYRCLVAMLRMAILHSMTLSTRRVVMCDVQCCDMWSMIGSLGDMLKGSIMNVRARCCHHATHYRLAWAHAMCTNICIMHAGYMYKCTNVTEPREHLRGHQCFAELQ